MMNINTIIHFSSSFLLCGKSACYPFWFIISSVKRKKKLEINKCTRPVYVCVHAYETGFLWSSGPSTGFLKRYLCLNPLLHPHVASHHENTRLFKKKCFSVAFFFTADKVMFFRIKYSIMDFPMKPLLSQPHWLLQDSLLVKEKR